MLYVRDLAHAGNAAQQALNGWLANGARTGPRLIAATSQPREGRVEAGLFDAVLYQRIARLQNPA